MPARRAIRAKDIVRDIRSGMTEAELMEKYRFSRQGLRSVFKKLVRMKAISRVEAYGKLPAKDDVLVPEDVDIRSSRRLPRHTAVFPIPIYDGRNPKITGTIRDVTETGLGVEGLQTVLGEMRTFVVVGDEFVAVKFETFAFDAVCRWISPATDDGPLMAGFEITNISPRDLTELRKLVESLSVGDIKE